jgi:hypothetical protein
MFELPIQLAGVDQIIDLSSVRTHHEQCEEKPGEHHSVFN